MKAPLASPPSDSSAPAQAQPVPSAVVKRSFVLHNPLGLHCRAAVLIIKALRRHSCDVTFEHGGWIANARSIVQLLGLATGPGAMLHVTASGPDRVRALNDIADLFASNFAEAYAADRSFCKGRVAV